MIKFKIVQIGRSNKYKVINDMGETVFTPDVYSSKSSNVQCREWIKNNS